MSELLEKIGVYLEANWPYVLIIIGVIAILVIVFIKTKPEKSDNKLPEEKSSEENELHENKFSSENLTSDENLFSDDSQEKSESSEPTKSDNSPTTPDSTEPVVKTTKTETKETINFIVAFDRQKNDWVIRKKGSQRATRRAHTKEEALKIAKELSKKYDANLTIKKKDGKFQKHR